MYQCPQLSYFVDILFGPRKLQGWCVEVIWTSGAVLNFWECLSGGTTPENEKTRGAHSSHFRSRCFENIDFDVFTSTYAEFDADHKIGLLFGIWGFWKA